MPVPAEPGPGPRILWVDDHALVREGLRRLVDDAIPGVAWGEAGDPRAALGRAREGPWDLVIVDLGLPGRGGLELVRELRLAEPARPVLAISPHAAGEDAARAFRAGAAGYLTLHAGSGELARAIARVLAGGRHVSPELAEPLAASLAGEEGRAPHDALSDRELQVLRLLGGGRSVKESAFELGLSDKTVSTYRARLLAKLGLRTSAELVRYAVRAGLAE